MSATAIVYLSGQFLPQDKAFVPVMDRGFIFGDGVYEVIPVYGGKLFRLEEHLARLDHSLQGIRLINPLSHEQWNEVLTTVVEQNGGGEQSVYLQVTRGHAPRDHAFPEISEATVFVSSTPLKPVDPRIQAKGVHAITLEDIRWKLCDIKSIALLPNILLRQQAIEAGAQEAILVRENLITEGAASNVFIVKDDVIETPPKSHYLLPGITRDLVLELAEENGIPFVEHSFTKEELVKADEIWLSSSTKEILPVTKLNHNDVSDGKPGPVWKYMIKLYQAYKQKLIEGKAV